MNTHKLLTASLCSAMALCAAPQARATNFVDFSFDGVANDTGPAFQVLDNGVVDGVQAGTIDIADGSIFTYGSGTGTSEAKGFNTVGSVDLSSLSQFTVEIVVDSGSLLSNFNGTFFGITTGPDSNNTNGSALYNNSGSPGNPSLGVQLGEDRGGTEIDFVVDQVGGNGSFFEISSGTIDQTSLDDGFTLFLTFIDNGAGAVGIDVSSTGVSTELSFSGTSSDIDLANPVITYASIANRVTGNVSAQGSPGLDLASYTIYDVASGDPADLDGDGDVDDADFGIAFAAFTGPNNGPSSNPAADLDGDGDVDDADFGIAFAAFTGPGGAAVPEPASLALLGLGGLMIARRRRAS